MEREGGRYEGGKAGYGIQQTLPHFRASWQGWDRAAPPSRGQGATAGLPITFLLASALSLSRVQSGWPGSRKWTRESGSCELSAAELRAPRVASHWGWSAARGSSPAVAELRLLDLVIHLPFP